MMIMPANNASGIIHFYAGRYPGKIGWLNSPVSWKNPPYYMPYAIDNGAFTKWDPENFIKILRHSVKYHRPLWIIVPDIVGDSEGTLKKWHYWHRRVSPFGPLAFAVQDGMEPQDVPPEAFCTFVGGTTDWKIKNAEKFKGVSPWFHIGRVNSENRVRWAKYIKADSIDGTGFFKANSPASMKAVFIEHFEGIKQMDLFE